MKNILALFGAIVAGVILANAVGSPAFAWSDLLVKARQAFSLDDEPLGNHPALQEWKAHDKLLRADAKRILEAADYNDACQKEYMRLLAFNAFGQNPPQNLCPKWTEIRRCMMRRRIMRQEATVRCLSAPVLGAVVIGTAMLDLIGAKLLPVTPPAQTTLVSPAPVTNDYGRENSAVANAGRSNDDVTARSRPRLIPPPGYAPSAQNHVGEYYEWETVEPGRVETRMRAAVYKTLTIPIVERPATIRRFRYYDMAGDLWVWQEYVPAEVRYVRRKVLVEPEGEETVIIPPKQRLVKRTGAAVTQSGQP
jgi:hypothetical protein